MSTLFQNHPLQVGFTGSRKGMTSAQRETFKRIFAGLSVERFHHGDCVGADADAHALVREGWSEVPIHIHPPTDDSLRAYCKGDTYERERGHLSRNDKIVQRTSVLLATPPAMMELARGGTWYTIRKARKKKRDIYIIWPNGEIQKESF